MEAEFLEQLLSLQRRCPPGVRLAGRSLHPKGSADPKIQRGLASKTARRAAAQLLRTWGIEAQLADNTEAGAPSFPAGFVGSLAHDCDVAVAAMALRSEAAGIGIDVEPAKGLPPECLQIVASRTERACLSDLVEARLLFCAKEAVFKAVSSSGESWLDHTDIEVDLRSETAVVRNHARLSLRVARGPRLLAVAILPPPPPELNAECPRP